MAPPRLPSRCPSPAPTAHLPTLGHLRAGTTARRRRASPRASVTREVPRPYYPGEIAMAPRRALPPHQATSPRRAGCLRAQRKGLPHTREKTRFKAHGWTGRAGRGAVRWGGPRPAGPRELALPPPQIPPRAPPALPSPRCPQAPPAHGVASRRTPCMTLPAKKGHKTRIEFDGNAE